MSQKSLWTFKLITKVLFLKLQPILYCTHPQKKMNFFKVTKLTVYNIPLTAEKHIITLAMNRLACSQPLCAILCNLLHYCPCYGKTHVWGRYNVYFWLSSQRVNMVSQIFTIFSLISVILSSTSGMGKALGYFLNFNSLDYFVDSAIKPIRIQSISVFLVLFTSYWYQIQSRFSWIPCWKLVSFITVCVGWSVSVYNISVIAGNINFQNVCFWSWAMLAKEELISDDFHICGYSTENDAAKLPPQWLHITLRQNL